MTTYLPTYLLIGAGKLAKHLQNYFSLLGLSPQSVLTWDRAQDPHLLRTKIAASTHILLAISDSALQSFYRLHLAGLDKTVVHFSGALSLEDMVAAHPLMSFGPELYPLETYQRIHFVLSAPAEPLENTSGTADKNLSGVGLKLADVLPELPNPFSVLNSEQKPFYHAMCVLGGNFPVILWQKMFAEFAQLGVPAEGAGLYLQTVLANTLKNPAAAFTGPLARKDSQTVSKNLEALKNDDFQNVYRAFVEAVTPELLVALPKKESPL